MRRSIRVIPLLLALAGCVTPRPEVVAPPAPPVEVRVPEIPVAPPPDLSPLAGRRVFIDPGHGGPWPGAVAPSNGLREADVNLRVARELARLIRGAGGEAILSRVDDTVPAPDSQSADLSARAQMGNESGAEVFASVHHNADITPGSTRNDLEVFYKLGESGPSLDLGQALTYELAYRFRRDAPSKLLLPGNYKVLRESRLPAVLLESAYMTNSGTAAMLATDAGVNAEALAIAAGLARYFSLDPPRVAQAELVPAADGLTHALVARFSRGLPIDRGSASVLLEGVETPGHAFVAGNTLTWTFQEPLPNGDLRFELRVRNARGVATAYPVDARVDRPAAQLVVLQQPPAFAGHPETEVLFVVHAEDALGLPVADGTPVRLSTTGATVETTDGVAHFYLPAGTVPGPLAFQAGAAQAQAMLRRGTDVYRSVRVQDALTGQPVAGAVLFESSVPLGVATEEGWAALPADVDRVGVARTGYVGASFALQTPHETLLLTPSYGGALHGKRIVLDPAYGGRNAGAIGPLGTRASDVNLEVVRHAAAGLREAGAEVLLTRTDDSDPSELRRVEMADEFEADIVVSVSYGAPGTASRVLDAQGLLREDTEAFVGHYPGSANGIRLARGIAQALGISTVTPSVAYVVQQTGSPAVLVQPASVADPQTEERVRSAETRRLAGEALCRGVIAYFTASPSAR